MLQLEDGFIKTETCSCYVILINNNYTIKLCYTLNLYISINHLKHNGDASPE